MVSWLCMTKNRPLLVATDALLAQLDFIRNKKQEYFVCLSLDSGGRLIARRVVTIGLLNVSLAHPREVFAGPLKDRAASVIVAHNHPSGTASPSKEDIKTTQQLVSAGILLGIPLHDHFIVTGTGHYSFRAHGLIA
jgi:DNA repair protein RadC